MAERKMKGRTLKGDPREYVFQLMGAKDAYKVMHEFSGEVQIVSPILVEYSQKKGYEPGDFVPEEVSQDALELIQYFPLSITWDRMKTLNKHMLASCKISIGDKIVELDEEGFGEIDTHEAYTALFFAIVANYEPIVAPLLGALGKQGEEDTDHSTEKNQESE